MWKLSTDTTRRQGNSGHKIENLRMFKKNLNVMVKGGMKGWKFQWRVTADG